MIEARQLSYPLLYAVAFATVLFSTFASAQDAAPRVGLPIQGIDRSVNVDSTGMRRQEVPEQRAGEASGSQPASTWGITRNPPKPTKTPIEDKTASAPEFRSAKQPTSAVVKTSDKHFRGIGSESGAFEGREVAQSPFVQHRHTGRQQPARHKVDNAVVLKPGDDKTVHPILAKRATSKKKNKDAANQYFRHAAHAGD